MKTPLTALICTLLILPSIRAALTIPSDGSDGAFAPAASVEVDLGQAVTGAWDANNAANAGKGIYDPAKWAVVFKFSSINIPAGVTVTFKNHPSRAPVVWLVSGNVTIAGTVDLRGKAGTSDYIARQIPTEPGPGGFRGGAISPSLSAGANFGPGSGSTYAIEYGNKQILPLIGGAGASANNSASGGGAGGAILIGAGLNLTLTGAIDTRGIYAGITSGACGGIRLIAEQITGNGTLHAYNSTFVGGMPGRIRIETPSLSPSVVSNPTTAAVPPANPPVIWPAANAPGVRILSIDGVPFSADPRAEVTSDKAPDALIAKTTAVTVLVETTNFPLVGVVQVRDLGKYGPAAWRTATLVPGGTFASATWSVSAAFPSGYTTLQAKATVP